MFKGQYAWVAAVAFAGVAVIQVFRSGIYKRMRENRRLVAELVEDIQELNADKDVLRRQLVHVISATHSSERAHEATRKELAAAKARIQKILLAYDAEADRHSATKKQLNLLI